MLESVWWTLLNDKECVFVGVLLCNIQSLFSFSLTHMILSIHGIPTVFSLLSNHFYFPVKQMAVSVTRTPPPKCHIRI